ncbi:MAG: histidinol-phosphatase HisJ family protein [Bacillota bacterium]
MSENATNVPDLGWAVDHHVHSAHSWDGSDPVDAYCRRALELGLGGIVFTDHVELDPDGKRYRMYDYDAARRAVEAAREKYRGLHLGLGVEVTYLRSLEGEVREFLRGKEFDGVMGSLHQVGGVDCSDPRGRAVLQSGGFDPRSVLGAYFDEMRAAVESGLFDVLGHIDVFLRLGADMWRSVDRDGEGRMGEVLDLAVRVGVAIEVNTSGFRHGVGHPHPGASALAAYRGKGGSLITLGSDAHRAAQLAWEFPAVAGMLRDLGFREVYFFRGRRPEGLPLPGGGGGC